MKVNYTLEQLKDLFAKGFGRAALYCTELADLATPIQVAGAVKERFGDCFLFESIEGGEKIARYSFIGFGPIAQVFVCDGLFVVTRDGRTTERKTSAPNAGIRAELGKCSCAREDGLPQSIKAARYHSLAVGNLPKALKVTARTADGEVMAIKHVNYNIYGVQFHPESILTEYGKEIISNFTDITEVHI